MGSIGPPRGRKHRRRARRWKGIPQGLKPVPIKAARCSAAREVVPYQNGGASKKLALSKRRTSSSFWRSLIRAYNDLRSDELKVWAVSAVAFLQIFLFCSHWFLYHTLMTFWPAFLPLTVWWDL